MSRQYSQDELMEMHSEAQSMYMREGLSRREAYKKAADLVIKQTGQSHCDGRPVGRYATEERRPSQRYPERPVRETPFEREYFGSNSSGYSPNPNLTREQHERLKAKAKQRFEKLVFQHGLSEDEAREETMKWVRQQYGVSEQPAGSSRSSPSRGQSSGTEYDNLFNGDTDSSKSSDPYTYTPAQLKAKAREIFEEWCAKGVSVDKAGQEAMNWYIRHAGPNNKRTGTSSRPSQSAFDDFSGMADALDDDDEDNYGARPRGSSRFRARGDPFAGKQRRPSGRENPQFDQYFTEEPRFSRGNSHYADEDGFPPRPRQEKYGPRSTHGFSSPFGGYDGTFDSDSGPRGYFTEERRPHNSSHSSYSSHGPDEHYSSYDTASGVQPAADLYDTLGVPVSASTADIKKAHRRLSLAHHPDRATGGPAAKQRATEMMALVNQAYDVLKDPEMRAFYDRTGLIASGM